MFKRVPGWSKIRPAFYEIPIFYALLLLINRQFLPDSPGFIEVEPHPYWLGILIFGFRYGIAAGLSAGVISSLLYFYFSWFYIERYLFYDASFYALPSWFIIIGTLIGIGVYKYQERISRLTQEKEMLMRNETPLRDEIKTLQEINRGLEKKVVTQMTSLVTLYQGAQQLETPNLESLYPAILQFIARTLEAEEASIYLRASDGWQLKESYGWKEYQQRSKWLKGSEGIIGMAGAKNKIVSVRDFIHKGVTPRELPELVGDCIVAGPLRMGEKGEIIGVLAIQKMPFLKFNSATINLLSFLLSWASRSIEHAHYIKDLKTKDILDPQYGVYATRYFMSRATEEVSRSQTYYLPLSFGLVRIHNMESCAPEQKEKLLLIVGQLLKDSCRDIDVVARYDEAVPFAIIFMTASRNQAVEMKHKILNTFAKLEFKFAQATPHLNIGISSFSPQNKHLDSLLMEARNDLEQEKKCG